MLAIITTSASVAPLDLAIELVAPYCDIVERLAVVPPSAARTRAVLQVVRFVAASARRSPRFTGTISRASAGRRCACTRCATTCIRLAVAGAALHGPERVHDGMHDVWRTNATTFASSLLGRTMLRLLSHDPVRLTEQGLAARRQTYQYGNWSIVRHGPRSIEMIYREEYIWIESAIAGGAVGAFEACGIKVNLQTKLINRFDGSTLISW